MFDQFFFANEPTGECDNAGRAWYGSIFFHALEGLAILAGLLVVSFSVYYFTKTRLEKIGSTQNKILQKNNRDCSRR